MNEMRPLTLSSEHIDERFEAFHYMFLTIGASSLAILLIEPVLDTASKRMPNRNVFTEYEHAYAKAVSSLYEYFPRQNNTNAAPILHMLLHAPGHLQHCKICGKEAPSYLVQD